MLKVLQVITQEHTSCRKKNSNSVKSDRSKIRSDWSKIKFCRILFKPNSPLAHYVIKVLDLFHMVYKGNPKTRFEQTLEVLLWDLKGIVSSSIKVIAENHSYIIRSSRSEVVATRLTTADDLNLQGWSWSLKLESLCC